MTRPVVSPGPHTFGTWARAQSWAVSRGQRTGLRYLVHRADSPLGHPQWVVKPLAERSPEAARLIAGLLAEGAA